MFLMVEIKIEKVCTFFVLIMNPKSDWRLPAYECKKLQISITREKNIREIFENS